MAFCILSRRETFSAAHRLHSPHLGDAENLELYGKCNHPGGHGHNYILIVKVRGNIDPKTGLVMNISTLKEILHKHVLNKMDHKNLDLNVEEFKLIPSTAENIAYVIWQWLKPVLGDLLYEVELQETEKNIAYYRGE